MDPAGCALGRLTAIYKTKVAVAALKRPDAVRAHHPVRRASQPDYPAESLAAGAGTAVEDIGRPPQLIAGVDFNALRVKIGQLGLENDFFRGRTQQSGFAASKTKDFTRYATGAFPKRQDFRKGVDSSHFPHK